MRVLIVFNFTDWNFKTHVKWHSEPFGRTLEYSKQFDDNTISQNQMRSSKFQMNKLYEWFYFYVKAHMRLRPKKIFSFFFAFPAKSIKTKTTIENRNKIIKIAINLICCTKFVYGYSVILSIVIILNSRTISKSLLK